ncbi:MAG: hypothetical protein AAFQ32_06060 [Pseudomonadota bacterium]
MIEPFDEWFALRNKHSDDDIWAAKLQFSEENGVALETVSLPKKGDLFAAPDCSTGTLTGYLDYQRPTTIIEPLVQSRGGGSIGVDTPVHRAKARIIAGAVLKNVHLEDSKECCFEALNIESPAFSAWYSPNLVSSKFNFSEDQPFAKVEVAIGAPTHEKFQLDNGITAKINSFTEAEDLTQITNIKQRVWLDLEFEHTHNLKMVQDLIWRINTLFCFLLGHQMTQKPYRLKTNHKRRWNGEDKNVYAELLFRPLFETERCHVNWHEALFDKRTCQVSVQHLLNLALKEDRSIFYLMNLILLVEKPKRLSANDLTELLGCIEDFHISSNGSGSSNEVAAARRKARRVLKEYGDESDLDVFDGLADASPNRLRLSERLDLLREGWEKYGFRGKPNSKEIVALRNDLSHGRGNTLEADDYQRVFWYIHYLCALSRFHIFQMIGISPQEIARAFRLRFNDFGRYAPDAEPKANSSD